MKLQELKQIDKKWKEYALAGCVIVLFYVVLTHLGLIGSGIAGFFKVLKPIVLGFVFAYIVNPIAVFFNKTIFKGVKKEKAAWILSIILTVIVVLLIITVLVASLIPQVVDSVQTLADNYLVYLARLRDFIANIPVISSTGLSKILDDFLADGGLAVKIGDFLKANSKVVIETTTSFGGAAMNGVIGGIIAIYFLVAKKNIQSAFAHFFSLVLSAMDFERLSIIMTKFNAIFSKYIVCELIDSAIVMILNYIFMLVCGMPNAIFVSVVIGVTNLAPTFGPIVGAAMGAFILLLVKPTSVLAFLIFTVVLQTLDGYVIKPKLFGDALNVPGVIILMSIIVFGKLMGVTGMLLSIPFAAIIVYIYSEIFMQWLEMKRELKQYKKDLAKEEQSKK